MTTFREFQAELEALHRQAERTRRMDKAAALERIRALIAEYDLQPAELGLEVDEPMRASTLAAKYRDPLTGATWSGRGRPPRWLHGKDRTAYLVRD